MARDYYISSNTGSDSGDGSESAPYQTLPFALAKLEAGDRLYMMDGRYIDWPTLMTPSNYNTGTEVAPIVVTRAPGHTPIIANPGQRTLQSLAFWYFVDLDMQQCDTFVLGEWGDRALACEGIRFVGNRWNDCTSNGAVIVRSVKGSPLIIDSNYCDNIRKRVVGGNASYMVLIGYCDDVEITNNTCFDLGGEALQISLTATVNGTVTVRGNEFAVRRPYLYRDENGDIPQPDPDQPQLFGNVGENAVDVKNSDAGHIDITDNYFHGFRPSDSSGQDASGSWGGALLYNRDVQSMTVERNRFENNTFHIAANNARSGVVIRNNYFGDVNKEDTYYTRGGAVTYAHIKLGNSNGSYLIQDNTFYQSVEDSEYTLLEVKGDWEGVTFRNNVMIGARIGDEADSQVNCVIDYNAWQNIPGGTPAWLQGNNDVNAADLLVEVDTGRPLPGSPVIGQGANSGNAFDLYGYPIAQPQAIGAVQELAEDPFQYSNDGDLPPGVTFHTEASGGIDAGDYTGTPTAVGVYSMITTASNADGETPQAWQWTVTAPAGRRTYNFPMDEAGGTTMTNVDTGTAGQDGAWDVDNWQYIPENSRNYPVNDPALGSTLPNAKDASGATNAEIQNYTDNWQ